MLTVACSNRIGAPSTAVERSATIVEGNAVTTNRSNRLSWQGWDGLHFDLSRRSVIPVPDSASPSTTESNIFERIFVGPVNHRGKIGMKLQLDGAAFLADKS